MQERIYVVEERIDDGSKWLVQASSQAQALRHICEGLYEVRVVKTVEMAELIKNGVQIESATEKAAE